MSGRVLDGRAVASRIWRELSQRTAALLPLTGAPYRLALVRFGAGGASEVYVNSLVRAARSTGVDPFVVDLPAGIVLSDVAARIGALNSDPTVAGIVLAQPMTGDLELRDVVELIDPAKDVDGATPLNAGRLARGQSAFAPATARAVLTILYHYDVELAGRRAVVVGRSAVVGRPAAELLLSAHASVMLTHSRTRNLARETRRAEILVVAAGSPRLIGPEMVNHASIVIDCGINVTPAGIVGDVDFDAVRPVVRGITPVPGGVGPVTTMCVLEQTVASAERMTSHFDEGDAMDRFRRATLAHATPDGG